MKLHDLPPEAFLAAFRTWRDGSGPLLPYVKPTPFVSLARYPAPLDLTDVPAPSLLDALPAASPAELLILDLPAALGLQTGLDLARTQGRRPILTHSHWYHPHGIVGDSAAASLLLLQAPPQPEQPAEGTPVPVALLLDYDRYRDGDLSPDRFNNQYELTEHDLPTAEELIHLGYTGACIVSSAPPKDDLRRYAAYLAAAGLAVRWHP